MKNHIKKEIEKNFPPPPLVLRTSVRSFHSKQSIKSPLDLINELPINEYALRDPLLFGDYRNAIQEDEPRFYEDLIDYESVYHLFQEIVVEYCERRGKLNLVLFEDCLEHLTRVHRTLRMNRYSYRESYYVFLQVTNLFILILLCPQSTGVMSYLWVLMVQENKV